MIAWLKSSFCFDYAFWGCYARFSGLCVPPNTELELSLSFSLRSQQRTIHCTTHRGSMKYLHITIMAVGLIHLLWVFCWDMWRRKGYIYCSRVRLELWNWLRVKERTISKKSLIVSKNVWFNKSFKRNCTIISKKYLIQQKFQKKLYHFNRNSQFRSVV